MRRRAMRDMAVAVRIGMNADSETWDRVWKDVGD